MAHPVAFSCTMTTCTRTAVCADLWQRLPLVLGRELAAQMLPVHWQSVDLYIQGSERASGQPGYPAATVFLGQRSPHSQWFPQYSG